MRPSYPGVGAVSSVKPSASLVQNEPDALIEALLEVQQILVVNVDNPFIGAHDLSRLRGSECIERPSRSQTNVEAKNASCNIALLTSSSEYVWARMDREAGRRWTPRWHPCPV